VSMNHPDEHTLELFAVGTHRLGMAESDVRDHLAQCQHCRRIVEEKQAFYVGVGEVVQDLSNGDSSARESLPGSPLPSLRRKVPALRSFSEERLPFHQDALRFVRNHPLVSSGGTLAGLALLGWLIAGPRQPLASDPDPSYVRINLSNSSVEVFNKSDRPLWSKPAASPLTLKEAADRNLTVAEVLDIEGDGHNRVATMIPLGADTEYDPHGFPYVRFFAGNGMLLSTVRLGHEVSFANRNYLDQFGYDGLASAPSADTSRQFLVAIADHFRSPSVLTVVEKGGNIAGEYWHYGHITSPVSVKGVMRRNQAVVLAFGSNDAADSIGIRYPVMVVLDPQKIVGMTESHLSRGFGYPACPGEIAYVRFPETDVAAVLRESGPQVGIMYRGSAQITVLLKTASVQIEYVFSLELKPLSARPLPGFAELHARLVKEGKVHSVFNEKYLEDLRLGVRFWDGNEWSLEPVAIGAGPA
jgi:hypothetical protein